MTAPLTGHRFRIAATGERSTYAEGVLHSLGATVETCGPPAPTDDRRAWAASGAMALTGPSDGTALTVRAPIASRALGVADALAVLTGSLGRRVSLDGAAILGERAACARLARNGRVAPGGRTRMLRAADGWFALGLARDSDHDLVPAWLEVDVAVSPAASTWRAIEHEVAGRPRHPLVERARALGLPAAPLISNPRGLAHCVADRDAFMLHDITVRIRSTRPPLVVDLSALWAGPLVAHILGLTGARVLKVEDPARPDGARFGPPAFFDLLHAGHESVALSFSSARDLATLERLLLMADVVIESSRPRALEQVGLDPTSVRARNPDAVWVSISGYGHEGQGRNWAALGDDAAVAGGLQVTLPDGTPGFCADAIADPLTGLHAAVAAAACLVGGFGAHIDCALSSVAGAVAAGPEAVESAPDVALDVAEPRARRTWGRAAPLGLHTDAVTTELAPARPPSTRATSV